MPRNRTNPDEEYHEFIQLVAHQQKVMHSLHRANEFLQTPDLTVEAARTRRDFIESKWSQLSARDEIIAPYESLPSCANNEYFVNDFLGTAEELFLDITSKLSKIINTAMAASFASTSTGAPAAVINGERRTQVPKLKLPQFSGKFVDWVEFRDHFQALIINDTSFDAFHRLYYLKSCLEGEAAALLKNIAITAENFDVAWKMLTERYEDKRRLLSIQLSKLFSLTTITREGSSADLRKLSDTAQESIDALNKLGRPVADDILVHLISQCFDRLTREAWELSLEGEEFATYDKLTNFLKLRIRALEASAGSDKRTQPIGPSTRVKTTRASRAQTHHASSSKVQPKCIACNDAHAIYRCPKFSGLAVSQRWDIIKRNKLCQNCLSTYHTIDACKSERKCIHCGSRHNSLLHSQPRVPAVQVPHDAASTSQVNTSGVDMSYVQSHLSTPRVPAQVVLATAWVLVTAPSRRVVKLRALLDHGSMRTFISQEVANALRTKQHATSVMVSGLGKSTSERVNKIIPISISSVKNKEMALSTDALILPSLTKYVPKFGAPIAHWPHLNGLEFADGCPTDDTPIHLIIGADLYAYAMRDGIIRGKIDEPVAMNTIFGWVISGACGASDASSVPPMISVHAHHAQEHESLHDTLTRFWETEEVSTSPPVTEDNEHCEQHFRDTHSRLPDGRYVVRIPFRRPPSNGLGDTYHRAVQCLHSIERRLTTRSHEREAYVQFMSEYEHLGHMRVAPTTSHAKPAVYLPHHPVIKNSSSTTKTRIVFNASSLSSNGTSLNELQLTGPALQADLPRLHMQWRTHRYVYAADIAKMYRQIRIDERDVDYQRILWRLSPQEAVTPYQLLTVTYGTASAPFLALRVLRQLAEDEGDNFPLGKVTLLNDFFVDDALFGADSIENLKTIRDELVSLLNKGQFLLRKWVGNAAPLLADIDDANVGVACDKELRVDDSCKILGISWRPATDSYTFISNQSSSPIITKRLVLSNIAKIFDPLGWIAPVVIVAKVFMQRLWLCHIDWDDSLPDDLATSWQIFYSALPNLTKISIPRWLNISPSTMVELHGFSDASSKAFAAVVYVRCVDPSGHCYTALLTAKTRVAPLKQLSIPRLELCGAVLLAQLLDHVRKVPAFSRCPIQSWTDATIVLDWLRAQSSQWKTFVANRVAEIHTLLPDTSWRHVPGTDNPADLASRGVTANEMLDLPLWWRGPSWLCLRPSEWPIVDRSIVHDDALLERRVKTHHAMAVPDGSDEIFRRFSSWPHLCRTLARVFCFLPQWRASLDKVDPFRPCAITLALVTTRIFKLLQAKAFSDALIMLEANPAAPDGSRHLGPNKRLATSSPLRRLSPFLDSAGLLRVGGRLQMTNLAFSSRHPVILPSGHVARLLATHAHARCLHGGITLTLSTMRQQTWVLQARKTVRSVIAHCVVCARQRAEVPTQLMGSLPPARATRPVRAFSECGVDYAGPVKLRLAGGRGNRSQPAYIALFICMASRAVHLELVSDYSSPAFLAAFQRFYSRRGLPSVVHSDCGTTFVGADKELRAAYRAAVTSDELRVRVAEEGVKWSLIPPAAPHFGGLWEAGVRSMKRHLKRVLDPHTPTYEELTTLLCRVEACMNSRPLAPLTDDIESLDTLTPAHFLVGGPLVSAPAPLALDYSVSRTTRWQLYSQLLEQFWTRWSRDYVTSCQHRSKWFSASTSLKVGQIVLLRNDKLPPAKWDLARVTACHPGNDGFVRVVTVRTAASEFKRPIAKLALLPIAIEGHHSPDPTL